MVRCTHRQTSAPRRRRGPPPRRAEPFLDSPAMVGDTHRHASTPRWRWVRVGHRHISQRHSRTHPRWWEVRTSMRPCLDGGGTCWPPPHLAEAFPDSLATVGGMHRQASAPRQRKPPAATTPHGAILGLTRDGGRCAPAGLHA
jgi:hypothetical protein